MTYNIISIDGGPAGLLPVMALQEIEDAVPGFLARCNLFAGTSSGAMTSMLLAKEANPAVQLPKAAYLWKNPAKLDHNDLLGYVRFLLGAGALNSTKYMREFLSRPDMLGGVRLSELKKKVVAVSYRVSPTPFAPVDKMFDWLWRAKVFNNFGGIDDPDYNLKAVDVAVASGSAPLFAPVFMGFVDGGVTANNPTMCALVQVIQEARPSESHEPQAALTEDLKGVRLLSIGSGRYEVPIKPFANWGYYQWLLNPAHPLLVVGALLQGGTDAVSFQAKTLLEPNGFFRFDPKYSQTNTATLHSSAQGQLATMKSRGTKELVQQVVKWVKECGWMDVDKSESPMGSVVDRIQESQDIQEVQDAMATADEVIWIVEPEAESAAAANPTAKKARAKKATAKRAPAKRATPAKASKKRARPVPAG